MQIRRKITDLRKIFQNIIFGQWRMKRLLISTGRIEEKKPYKSYLVTYIINPLGENNLQILVEYLT